MTAEAPHFKIRLPQTLKARLEQAARISGLSMTAEIVQRLEDSFESVEMKMLGNRFDELGLVKSEIAALAKFNEDERTDAQSKADAAAQIESLKKIQTMLVDQISFLTVEISRAENLTQPKQPKQIKRKG